MLEFRAKDKVIGAEREPVHIIASFIPYWLQISAISNIDSMLKLFSIDKQL